MDGGSVPGLTGGGHAAPLLGELAEALFQATDWPYRPESVRSANGREWIPGVSDPEEASRAPLEAKVVSPPPDYTWRGTDGGPARVALRAVGPEAETVHWFVNGRWLGEACLQREWVVELEAGTHSVRAVFGNGRAESRTVTILSL
jgi:membrane carboxypeptidase/penicillin-binding protein PbpC